MIFYYLLFNHSFKYKDYVCKICYDLLMLFVNISGIGIITAKSILLIRKCNTIDKIICNMDNKTFKIKMWAKLFVKL